MSRFATQSELAERLLNFIEGFDDKFWMVRTEAAGNIYLMLGHRAFDKGSVGPMLVVTPQLDVILAESDDNVDQVKSREHVLHQEHPDFLAHYNLDQIRDWLRLWVNRGPVDSTFTQEI